MSCIPFSTRQMRTTILLRPNELFWMNRFRSPAQALAFVNDCLITHGFYQVTAQQAGRKRSGLAALCVGEGGWVRFRKGLKIWQSDLVIPHPGNPTGLGGTDGNASHRSWQPYGRLRTGLSNHPFAERPFDKLTVNGCLSLLFTVLGVR